MTRICTKNNDASQDRLRALAGSFSAGPGADGSPRQDLDAVPIETLRGLAVLMLVAYHVVGGDAAFGLMLDYPHPLRILSDFLAYCRMPLFAFVAGYVFAIKPLKVNAYPRFLEGKLRRLAVPGCAAIVVFALASTAIGSRFVPEWSDAWKLLVYPYAHFWFLQAILVIFVVYGLLDAVTKGAALVPAFAMSIAMLVAGPRIPTDVLALNAAVALLPYFLLGVLVFRQELMFLTSRRIMMMLSAIVCLLFVWALYHSYQDSGAIAVNTRTVTALAGSTAIILLLASALPSLSVLSGIGAISFTIYLYHVFGTSLARRVAWHFGVEDTYLVMGIALCAGIALPCVLHVLAARRSVTRRLLLGLK